MPRLPATRTGPAPTAWAMRPDVLDTLTEVPVRRSTYEAHAMNSFLTEHLRYRGLDNVTTKETSIWACFYYMVRDGVWASLLSVPRNEVVVPTLGDAFKIVEDAFAALDAMNLSALNDPHPDIGNIREAFGLFFSREVFRSGHGCLAKDLMGPHTLSDDAYPVYATRHDVARVLTLPPAMPAMPAGPARYAFYFRRV